MDRLKRIKTEARTCVKEAKTLYGLGCFATDMRISSHLIIPLAQEIEQYEEVMKQQDKP